MQISNSIITSDIVTTAEDIFWNELPEKLKTSKDITLLVICKPVEEDSSSSAQLQKMLQACQLNDDQYHVLYIDKPLPWHKLKEAFSPNVVLLLGVHPQELGVAALFHLFAPNNFDGNIWIVSLALSELEKQTDMKKQLWAHGLKPVFVDKTFGNI